MKDMQAHLERLRVQTAECEMIRDLATDRAKRDLFNRLAQHYKVLAGQLENEFAKAIPQQEITKALPLPDVVDRVALLENRAEEYRAIAAAMSDQGLREQYLRLADSCAALARNEEAVEKRRALLRSSPSDTF